MLQEQLDKAVEYLLKAINFAKKNPRYCIMKYMLSVITYVWEISFCNVNRTLLSSYPWHNSNNIFKLNQVNSCNSELYMYIVCEVEKLREL